VRRGARWSLSFGLALAAISVSGACAEVRFVDLDECSASCIAPAIDDLIGAADKSWDDIPSSVFSGGGTDGVNDARADLIFDPDDVPPVLVGGLPSPMGLADGRDPSGRTISPYDFFAEVIDIPLPVDVRTGMSAVSILLFAPSLIGRVTLTDILSNSNAAFVPPSFHPEL
jgi:hypothetical protein